MFKTPIVAALVGAALAAPAFALTVPYTETFASPAANWSSAATFTPLTYVPAGGPDASGYASRSVSFATNPVGDIPLIFRGQSNFASSGGNFWGDWTAGAVTAFSFTVRHDAPTPVSFFARFTPGATGAVALVSPPVQPNTWSTFTIAIDPSTPFIYEGPGVTFASTFSNVNRVQVGVMVDAAIAGQSGPYTFDIDNVSIVPAPSAGAALAGLGLAALRRRRR
ncbi:MAG TPA: hypothetical protein VHN77_01685 [Phycisphaerales bacterium]|nr:hypothetical protein [Phycisphaerales bacterium]